MEDFNISSVKKVAWGLLVFVCFCWGYTNFVSPNIYIWQQSRAGEAQLAHAQYSRQIAILEANAKKESAKSLSDAEVIRAEGVAKANEIIGDSLKGNEGYLKYLWIQGMQTNQMQVVYVPTEANLPILESGRWGEEERNRKGPSAPLHQQPKGANGPKEP